MFQFSKKTFLIKSNYKKWLNEFIYPLIMKYEMEMELSTTVVVE